MTKSGRGSRGGAGKPDVLCDIPVEDRIRFIAQEMVAGRWHHSRLYECAEAWNVSLSTVRWNSGEASRHVRQLFTPEELRNMKDQALAFLEELAHDCKARGKDREAIMAVGQLAEIAGWRINKHEFSGPGGAAIVVQSLKHLNEDAIEDRILVEAEAIAKKRALRAQAQAGRGALAPRAAIQATIQANVDAARHQRDSLKNANATATSAEGANGGAPEDPGPSVGDG
jgi:hypothetical protein